MICHVIGLPSNKNDILHSIMINMIYFHGNILSFILVLDTMQYCTVLQ